MAGVYDTCFLLQKFICHCASLFLLLEDVFIIFKRESPMN